QFRELARWSVGFSPVSVQRSSDGRFISIACLWPRRMVVLNSEDIANLKGEVRRFSIDLPFAPRRQIAILQSNVIVVADAFGGQIAVVDLEKQKVSRVRQLGVHNIRGLALDASGENLFLSNQFLNPTAATQKGDIQNGNVISNNICRISVGGL